MLISRTALRPVPATPWVRATVSAVRASVVAGEAIVTGFGRDAYDLTLLVCRDEAGCAIVVLERPFDEESPELRDLLPKRHLLVWADDANARNRPRAPGARDRLIGELADRAWTIEVRAGGNMEAIRTCLKERGCSVDSPYVALSDPHDPDPPLMPRQESRGAWPFLTHYTREPDGQWPDESRSDYLRWLTNGPLDSRRGPADALRRIIESKRIRGSGRLMPRRAKMVSLTKLAPWQMRDLMRWRSGLHHWTFRPYGIAIAHDVLGTRGARPVQYLPPHLLDTLAPADRDFAQKHDPPSADWSAEQEWRLRGDLDLSLIARESQRILVPSVAEAHRFESEFEIPALAISE